MRIRYLKSDQRKAYRFPIQHELRFSMLRRGRTELEGTGLTVDISSGGVAFETDQPLRTGALVELAIQWPALLDGGCPIQLIVLGRVVRVRGHVVACALRKYDFRTQARSRRASTEVATGAVLRRWAQGAS